MTGPSRLFRFRSIWPVLALWALLVIPVVRRPPTFAFGWDTFGYHLYLPAAIIHDDPLIRDMSWVDAARTTYDASSTLYQISTMPNGSRIVRYPIGLSITWSPWFMVGHVVAKFTGHPQDGFSKPYQVAVVWGMLLYFLLGLLVLRAVLSRMFNDTIALITILLVVLGTNLLDQCLGGQTMPHLTLFSLYALILHSTQRWRASGSIADAAITALFIGLAALIRPTEIIAVLIPLLWPSGDDRGWWRRLLGQWRQWFVMGTIMLAIGMVQFTYWKLATGSWVVDSYANPGEGLDLLGPHTLPFLFSFRKGWFLYTPLMGIATAAIALLWRHRNVAALPVTVFFIVNLYLVSSWTCWWYADSFSSRAMVGSYAVMAVPLAHLLAVSLRWRMVARLATWLVLAACFTLNLFQHWQFYAGMIHSSRMSKDAYLAVWGSTERPAGLNDLLLVERSSTGDHAMRSGKYTATKAFGDLHAPFFGPEENPFDTALVETLPRTRLGKDHEFSAAFRLPYREITQRDHVFLELRWFVRPQDELRGTYIVSTFEHGGSYAYSTADIHDLGARSGAWTRISHWYMTPEIRDEGDPFTTYCWSSQGGSADIVGPVVIVHEPITE